MSQHKVCCAVGVCCPPRKQQEHLAHIIEEAGSPEAAAKAILAIADLVPLGVGHMIRETYGPLFKEAAGTPDGKA